MPTLQKYKKLHADRIPSVGEGRRQRYPVASLEVFQELREEGLSRRGRRPKSASASARGSAVRGRANEAGSGLLSLQQIRSETGISYPTLLRYTKLYLDRIPHVGTGKRRRYPKHAVEVFRELRRGSTRGRKPAQPALLGGSGGATGGDVARRLVRLEGSQRSLERQIRELTQMLKRPMVVTVRRG
ncbi:MAG TPA: hypothetical protein VNB06_11785 [Thermoanaerobaculia bacterium]|nr:hypothetical protein [Thermoanaerobaculia bacterium]